MQPDYSIIVQRLSISEPLVGFYDAPDAAPFEPLVVPGARQCIYGSLKKWRAGKTLHLTREKHGCGGVHLFGESSMSRGQLVDFLCDEEGLRANRELMELWLDSVPSYRSKHEHLLFGPLRADQYEFLRTVTFYVNPDQLAVLSRRCGLLQPSGRRRAGRGPVRIRMHAARRAVRRPRSAAGPHRGDRPGHAPLSRPLHARLHGDAPDVRAPLQMGRPMPGAHSIRNSPSRSSKSEADHSPPVEPPAAGRISARVRLNASSSDIGGR